MTSDTSLQAGVYVDSCGWPALGVVFFLTCTYGHFCYPLDSWLLPPVLFALSSPPPFFGHIVHRRQQHPQLTSEAHFTSALTIFKWHLGQQALSCPWSVLIAQPLGPMSPSLVLVTQLSAAPSCLEPDWQQLPECPPLLCWTGIQFLGRGLLGSPSL